MGVVDTARLGWHSIDLHHLALCIAGASSKQNRCLHVWNTSGCARLVVAAAGNSTQVGVSAWRSIYCSRSGSDSTIG